jgi:hypothetical protein
MKEKIEKIRDQWLKRSYYLAKNSAKYQGHDVFVSWEIWRDLWCKNDNYLRKGRGKNDLCLARNDIDKSWTDDNVSVRTRHEVLIQQAKDRREKNDL